MMIIKVNPNINHSMKHIFNTISFAYAAILTIAAGLLCSCSSDRDKLLESVPSDTEFVATFNFIKLAKEAGVTVEDGRAVLPPEMSFFKEKMSADFLKEIGKLATAVDLENVVAFGSMNKGIIYLTASVNDADEIRSIARNAEMERETEDGRTVYSESDSKYAECIVLNEDETQVWLIPERRYLPAMDDFEFARKKNNILRFSGLANVLKSDNIANMVIDQSALRTGLDDYWVTTTVNVDNNAIVAVTNIMKPDGEEYETDVLKPVDTDFLRYMPANFIAAAAIGINPESNWVNDVSKALESTLGYRAKSQIDELTPYLKALDGTIAIGFGPKNKLAFNSSNPADWQVVAMAHMKQNKVNQLTETVNNLFPRASQVSNGLYSITEDGATITYGSVDGYFAVALGVDLKPDKNNSFANDFNGKPLAVVMQTPLLNTIVNVKSLDFSVKCTLEVNGTSTRIQMNLVGTDKPIIPTLAEAIPRFAEAYYNMTHNPLIIK